MAAPSLEERVAVSDVTQEAAEVSTQDRTQDERPWWEQVGGTFQNDPVFEEVVRLGREYRESLRPGDGESETECLF